MFVEIMRTGAASRISPRATRRIPIFRFVIIKQSTPFRESRRKSEMDGRDHFKMPSVLTGRKQMKSKQKQDQSADTDQHCQWTVEWKWRIVDSLSCKAVHACQGNIFRDLNAGKDDQKQTGGQENDSIYSSSVHKYTSFRQDA